MLRKTCDSVAKTLNAVCILLVVAIVIALSLQIVTRYVFNMPLHYTDATAEIALVWLTFLGAALLYRERGHILVDLVAPKLSVRWRGILGIVLQVLIAAVVLLIIVQAIELRGTMTRVRFGVLPATPYFSKFAMLIVPVILGGIATLLFIAERCVNLIRTVATAEDHDCGPSGVVL